MALKSKEWFYKQCLIEVHAISPFAHLCWRALEIGVGQILGTRGHCTQAIGAIQNFLETHPQHVPTIQAADRTRRFEIDQHGQLLQDWTTWFQQQAGTYGQTEFGYNYDTLRR